MRIPADVRAYYDRGGERLRLTEGAGRWEHLRTTDLLARWLPPAPAVVFDVGGASGAYAVPLAQRGYVVHLLDPVPLHVRQAAASSRAAERPLASVSLGDARALPAADASVDVVLLLGPLYHLIETADRRTALLEAARVLRPGGLVVAAAISRWASVLDGFARGLLADPGFVRRTVAATATGRHTNPDQVEGQFATAYFHRPDELAAEVAGAGFVVDGPVAVEGPTSGVDFAVLLDGGPVQERALDVLRGLERVPDLLGASAHLLVAGRQPD